MGAHEDRMTRLQESELGNELLLKNYDEVTEKLDKAEARVRVLEEALSNLAESIERVGYRGEVGDVEDLDQARHEATAALASEGTSGEAS